MNETGSLLYALRWLLEGGAGVVAYWFMENIPRLAALPAESKRYAAIMLSAVLGMATYALMIILQYQSAPTDWRAWAEGLFAAAFLSVSAAQIIHGRLKLKARTPAADCCSK